MGYVSTVTWRLRWRPFEVEVSVEQTESPTTNAQHVYIAHQLRRLGVRWVSLAPRSISAFEKGVDFSNFFERRV